jgi:hypothetical protein
MGRKTALFWIILVFANLSFCALLYFASILLRSAPIYNRHDRWIGRATHLDKTYGHFPTPNAFAYHSLPFGERVAVRFDEHGFRVPHMEQQAEPGAPRILFLGDSFTHGYGVPAERTFAYRTAKHLGASAMNGGVSGWGLAQMVLRAREVIPNLKPAKVVVQYSTWLPNRSMKFYQSRLLGKSPYPYFYKLHDTMAIHPPPFEAFWPDLTVDPLVGPEAKLLPFVWQVGIPLFLHDDYFVTRTLLYNKLGVLPSPAASRQQVIDYAYREIRRLCEENGAEMIIVAIPRAIGDRAKDQLNGLADRVIDVWPTLVQRLPERSPQVWDASFKFWGNGQIVDNHPNARMHKYIAEVLADAMRIPSSKHSDIGALPRASQGRHP